MNSSSFRDEDIIFWGADNCVGSFLETKGTMSFLLRGEMLPRYLSGRMSPSWMRLLYTKVLTWQIAGIWMRTHDVKMTWEGSLVWHIVGTENAYPWQFVDMNKHRKYMTHWWHRYALFMPHRRHVESWSHATLLASGSQAYMTLCWHIMLPQDR